MVRFHGDQLVNFVSKMPGGQFRSVNLILSDKIKKNRRREENVRQSNTDRLDKEKRAKRGKCSHGEKIRIKYNKIPMGADHQSRHFAQFYTALFARENKR